MFRQAHLLLSALLCAGALTSSAIAADSDAAPSADGVFVPRHTVIPVLVTKDVRVGGIGDAREAKKVEFEVLQDVVVDGHTIAKKGDLVEGHYTTQRNATKRVFSANVSQELALDVDDAVNFCGDTLHLTFERTFVGGARGGLMSFGMHAHDAVFSKGIKLKAETDRPQKNVCSEKPSADDPPLPSDLLLPDDQDPNSSNPAVKASPTP